MDVRLGAVTFVVEAESDAFRFALLEFAGAYQVESIRDGVLGVTIRCSTLEEAEIISRTFPPFAQEAWAKCAQPALL